MTVTDDALLPLLGTIARMRKEARTATLAVIERSMRGGHMTPLHVHDEDEAYHVVEGSVTIHAGDETVQLEAGESYLVPAGVPHTHRAESAQLRYLATTFVRSLARYEDFLRAVAPVAEPSRGWRSWGSDDEAAAVTSIGAANAITVLGPPGLLPSGSARRAGRAA
jgi:mannose-6-phosphate isomerase-like protein (cupin superfamily)